LKLFFQVFEFIVVIHFQKGIYSFSKNAIIHFQKGSYSFLKRQLFIFEKAFL